MAWHETWDLTQELVKDPTSRVAAAVAEWSHPITHESMVLRDLYDLLAIVNSGRTKPRPYPRPWDNRRNRTKSSLPRERIREILVQRRAMNEAGAHIQRDSRGRLHGPNGRYVKG